MTNYLPDGYHSLTPYLAVKNSADAVDFYQKAFGAEIIHRLDGPDGTVMHAELRIGNSLLQVSEEMPDFGLTAPTGETHSAALTIYSPDADAMFNAAIATGATELSPMSDEFSGDRIGRVRCPFGHRWVLATHIEDISPDELARRVAAFTQGS